MTSATQASDVTWRFAAGIIDHTLLKPDATRHQITRLCEEALEFGFCSVCVHPGYVALVHSILRGSLVKVCTVIGFPSGATVTTAKCFEAAESLRLGATELDMVINVGALKSGEHEAVETEIRSLAQLAHGSGGLLKVIIESALLTMEEKIRACEISVAAGADFVKTSTGFAGGGATVDDVALMRRVVRDRARIKASGGIRTAADLRRMVVAGADRIGCSASVAIVRELGAP